MRYYTWAVIVGLLNVALNEACKKAGGHLATNAGIADKRAALAIAFIVGCCSLTALITFYWKTGESLARGIVIIGATSILAGSVYGTYAHGNIFKPIEWMLLGAIVLFYAVRAMRAFS